MTDETTEQDVNEQEVVAPAEDVTESTPKPQEPEAGSKEFNFRALEQQMQQIKSQNYELMQEVQRSQAPKKQELPDPFAELEKDDLITFGQVEEYTTRMAEKKTQEYLERELNKREEATQPARAKQQYSDFDQIVTEENIQLLIKEDPELELLIQNAPNKFTRAYKEIKKSDFFRERGANKQNEQKLEENSRKPTSSNSLGSQRPLSQANSYSKDDLYAEMMQCGKGGY